MFVLVSNDESLKPPSRGILESLFCCWRNGHNISRRSKSAQNGSAVDGTVASQTIGQATGLGGINAQNRFLLPQIR